MFAIEDVLITALEEDGRVWRETVEVVSLEGGRGLCVAYGRNGRGVKAFINAIVDKSEVGKMGRREVKKI